MYPDVANCSMCSTYSGRKLFGDGYSGLEYDYRGLLRLYQAKTDVQKSAHYTAVLHEWNMLRDRNNVNHDVPFQFTIDSSCCEASIQKFFSTDDCIH